VTELSALEKALTKSDYAGMKSPLAEMLRALRPMNLKSLEALDPNARGRLITSLMRVMRMPKPKEETLEAAPMAEGDGSSGSTAEGSDSVAASREVPVEAAGVAPSCEADATAIATVLAATTPAPAEGSAEASAEGSTEAAVAPVTAENSPARAPAVKAFGYSETQLAVGLIWNSVGDVERAGAAFKNAGREPTEAELAAPTPRAAPERSERPARGPRESRGSSDRPGAARRDARGPRAAAGQRMAPFVPSGNWQDDAKKLEEMGRTRDAGRLHEKNQSFAEAVRLFEKGGDTKSAIKACLLGKLDEPYAALAAKLKPEELAEALEGAQAWERLMELHVARQDFDAIARLYERAQQFDQAGLAWERAGKLAPARKAYERARDFAAAGRVRELEVQKLLERGDRLGAATLLVAAGRKSDAIAAFKDLPGPKAFHFMNKLNLTTEARAFGQEELSKAEASGNLVQKGRWLELLGDPSAAIATYLAAERKDKAALVYEASGDLKKAAELFEASGQLDRAEAIYTKAGDSENAGRVKALPRPVAAPAPSAEVTAEMVPAAESANGSATSAS
jgi:tetratricopeptide (TPR) repeat protein